VDNNKPKTPKFGAHEWWVDENQALSTKVVVSQK
jgi:hypothetical protein